MPALSGDHRGARARVAAIVIVTFSSRGWVGDSGRDAVLTRHTPRISPRWAGARRVPTRSLRGVSAGQRGEVGRGCGGENSPASPVPPPPPPRAPSSLSVSPQPPRDRPQRRRPARRSTRLGRTPGRTRSRSVHSLAPTRRPTTRAIRRAPAQLRPARRLLICASIANPGSHVADPVVAGEYARLRSTPSAHLLIGWAEVASAGPIAFRWCPVSWLVVVA